MNETPELTPAEQKHVTYLLQLAVMLRLQLFETIDLDRELASNLTPTPARQRALLHLDEIIQEFCVSANTPAAIAERATAETLITILDDWPPDEDPEALEAAQ